MRKNRKLFQRTLKKHGLAQAMQSQSEGRLVSLQRSPLTFPWHITSICTCVFAKQIILQIPKTPNVSVVVLLPR